MKNITSKMTMLLIAILLCGSGIAQVTNEGIPLSWDLENKKNTNAIEMQAIDFVQLAEEDKLNDLNKGAAYRFGYEFETNFGLDNAGVWDNLPNGDRIWRINFTSQGANTLNFIFDQYWLPIGAKVYLYSDDRQTMIGAYTNVMNHPEEKLGTWLVDGDNIWIEYYEPANVIGQGKLNIGTVVHGYRSVTKASLLNKGLNDSGDCNLDVDCTIGADFDPKKDLLKHAVANIASGGFVCTGTLLNNTANDKAPYFIFANHCTFDPAVSAFRFNWISPNPICAATTPSTTSTFNTTSGATLLATAMESDYRLFRLTGGLDPTWDLEWAGWDATDVTPAYQVGIHHPAGDIMKVCRNNSGLVKETMGGQVFWTISDQNGETGWEIGVTEGGSSGSGLFNPAGQLIGTLCCGTAACTGTTDNDGFDQYGRFATSYTNGMLAQWLDPTNSGVLTLLSLSEQILSVSETSLDNNLSIYPNPSTGIVNIRINGNSSNNFEYTIYTIDGRKVSNRNFTSDTIINMESQSNGIYFIKIKDNLTSNVVTKKVIIKK